MSDVPTKAELKTLLRWLTNCQHPGTCPKCAASGMSVGKATLYLLHLFKLSDDAKKGLT